MAEIKNLNESRSGLECEADVGERVRRSTELGQYGGSLTDAAQQLICNQQVIGSNPIADLECKLMRAERLRI